MSRYMSWDIHPNNINPEIRHMLGNPGISHLISFFGGYPGICRDKSSSLGYPSLCWGILRYVSAYQTYTGITQDNRVADAARWMPALPRWRCRPTRLPQCLQQC